MGRMSRFGRSGRSDTDLPDFASLYAGDAVLTPRMAAHLWVAAVYLSDTYGEDPQSELLSAELPPIARRLADDAWLARFVSCFETLAVRLGTGLVSEQLASCTAEEMALHMVIDCAEASVAEGTAPTPQRLPRRGAEDTDFDWAREVLFRDHDVLMLFNVSLDGIEDDTSELAEYYRFANLHPRDWFIPFADVADP
jgi:hypothetical protein